MSNDTCQVHHARSEKTGWKEEALSGWEYKKEETILTHTNTSQQPAQRANKTLERNKQGVWCQFQMKVSKWCEVCTARSAGKQTDMKTSGKTCVRKPQTPFTSAKQHTSALLWNEKAMQHLMFTEVSAPVDIWSEHDPSLTVSWDMYVWCNHIQINS